MRSMLMAAALALAVAVPARAVPPDAQESLAGWATFRVVGRDRAVYQVYVNATVPSGHSVGTPSSGVGLWVTRCQGGSCDGEPVKYWAPLSPGQYDARDEKKWSIRLSAFGKPFTVTWTGPGATGAFVLAVGTEVSMYSAWKATARVTTLGRTCVTDVAGAERRTSAWLTGRPDPTWPRIPSRPPAGVPSSARACHPF